MSTTCEVLRRVSFLRELGSPLLERIAAGLRERRFARGTLLFNEGEPCPGFWLVKEGGVHLVRTSAAGRVQILRTCVPDDVFGLAAAVDGGPYSVSAEVREDAVLILFPREELLAAMRAEPAAALAVAQACAARLRRVTALAALVTLHDVRERVAAFLCDEGETHGVRRSDGQVEVFLGASQHEIARGLGMAREVYARALKSLETGGLIEHERHRVRIRAPRELRLAAG